MKRLAALFLAVSLCGALSAAPPPELGRGGAVATNDPLATQVGIDLLKAGGNAVDAAVGTALALAVVFPEAGNLGGGGFAVIKMRGELAALDFREVGPAAARPDLYLDAQGKVLSDASKIGPLAAGVPGSPAGLWELHRKYGKLAWAKVVAPAKRLAERGFPVGPALHDRLADRATRKILTRFPETAAFWYPGGEPLRVGTLLRQPDLARTLGAYAKQGPAGVVTGAPARAIEAASRKHGGILTAADLAAYQPVWRAPLRFEAFGWQFAAMPLPSSGGILTAETFGFLDRLGWARQAPVDRAHLLAESFRRAYADRFLLSDPATTRATAEQLLAPSWLDARAAAIDRSRATPSSGVQPWAEKPDTTHLSVADPDGNLVALTTTLNDLFGCGLWVPEAGFFLNNEMDDFTAAPGQPNLFGLIQGEANAVGPGKRMLSSMSPTLAWRGSEAVVTGGRGGSRIPTNTMQVLLRLLVEGDPLPAAEAAPRLHHQWQPDRLEAEPAAFSPEISAELERRGHRLEISDVTAKVFTVRVRADGCLEAAADPRGPGSGATLRPGCPAAPASPH